MNLGFRDVIDKMKYHASHKEEGYNIPLAPKYNETVGNVMPGIYTALTGLPTAGTTSFLDQNYVMNVLLQWYMTDPDERPHLHIKYYSLKTSELKKLQTLICSYIKLVHNLRVDIPTLNSQPGKIYDIGEDQAVLEALDEAEAFFDEILNNDVLEIIDTQMSGNGIFNSMTDYMDSIGSLKDGVYSLDEDKADALVMVVVDSTDNLINKSDGFSSYSDTEMHLAFSNHLKSLSSTYKINCTVVVPASVGYIRTPKDTEPHYRHLGVYSKGCDRGVVLYNPIAEGNMKYYNEGQEIYVDSGTGMNFLRYWSVVINTDGVNSVHSRLLFLPGTSYMYECTDKMADKFYEIAQVKSTLFNKDLSPYTTTYNEDED